MGGNLTLNAGAAINIAGSDLTAGKDISLAGNSVTITPGQDQVDGKFTSKMTQDGFTLAVGGSAVNAIQTMQSMSEAVGQAKSSRVTAMAAATTAMAAKYAADDIARNGVSISVSVTAGYSENEQTQTTASTTHSGSVLAAGNNVAIGATGGGKDSNITIVGSDIGAGNNIALKAGNQVNLLAAQDLESQHSESKSVSAAAGVAAGYSSKGVNKGLAVGIIGSLAASRGTENGQGTTQLNSHVSAGAQLSIASGGDTNLKGAVASGAQVVADVGGNLNIESLQDTAKFGLARGRAEPYWRSGGRQLRRDQQRIGRRRGQPRPAVGQDARRRGGQETWTGGEGPGESDQYLPANLCQRWRRSCGTGSFWCEGAGGH